MGKQSDSEKPLQLASASFLRYLLDPSSLRYQEYGGAAVRIFRFWGFGLDQRFRDLTETCPGAQDKLAEFLRTHKLRLFFDFLAGGGFVFLVVYNVTSSRPFPVHAPDLLQILVMAGVGVGLCGTFLATSTGLRHLHAAVTAVNAQLMEDDLDVNVD